MFSFVVLSYFLQLASSGNVVIADVYPSTLDIACKQLSSANCLPQMKRIIECPKQTKTEDDRLRAGHETTSEVTCSETEDNAAYSNEILLLDACKKGKLDVVKCILSQGMADINCRFRTGRTPVMQATRNGHLALFNFLVQHGCDLSVVDKYNDSVLHVACAGGNIDIVRNLINNHVFEMDAKGWIGRTPLLNAVYSGHKKVFDLLVNKGCDMKKVDAQMNNILHVACMGGHIDMIRYIIKQNIVSLESKGFYGRTPLMLAVQLGHASAFDFLLHKGCYLLATDNLRNNILHMASISCQINMVKHVLRLKKVKGMKKRMNNAYNTPVKEAASRGCRSVVSFFNQRKYG